MFCKHLRGLVRRLECDKLGVNSTKLVVCRFLTTCEATQNDPRLSHVFTQPSHDLGFQLSSKTLSESLHAIAAKRPKDVAFKFVAINKSITYLELQQRVDELAQSLLRLGFVKGDRLAIMLPNTPEFLYSTLAAASIGVISVLMSSKYDRFEIEHMLKKNECKGVIILDNYQKLRHYEILKSICPELRDSHGILSSSHLPHLKYVIVVNNRIEESSAFYYKGTVSFKDIQRFSGASRSVEVNNQDVLALLFTSGASSGFPRSSPVTHNSMINASIIESHYPGCFDSNQVTCLPFSMSQGFGFCVGVVSSIVNGHKIVLPDILSGNTVLTLEALEQERCTALKGPPAILTGIINHPNLKKFDLSSLKQVLVAEAMLSKDMLLKARNVLNLKHIIVGYGAIESSCMGSMTRVSDAELSEKHAYESIGTGVPGIEIKIVDRLTRQVVPRNVDGEICLRGEYVMKGYWNDTENTREVMDEEGFLRTGDFGCMDSQGYLYFKAKIRDLITKENKFIYPIEIEKIIRFHEKIVECHVFGVPALNGKDEEICVWVKLRPDAQMTDHELKDYCLARHLDPFKVPKYIKFVDEFPKSRGRVKKYIMVDKMISELHYLALHKNR